MKSIEVDPAFADRLLRIKDYVNESYAQMAKKTTRSKQSFYDISKGRANLSHKMANEICAAYPSISFEWLMYGEGEMLKPGHSATASHHSTAIAGNNISTNSDSAAFLELLKEKDRQLAKRDEQIDRLISLLEKASSPAN